MKFIIIDTSGKDSFIALFLEREIQSTFLPEKEQNKYLLAFLDQLLKSNGLSLNDLDFIATGNGPGSFTGTRIGVLTAKTLSFAKKIPLVPFCSLMRFAPEVSDPFLIIHDAKTYGVYGLAGNIEGDTPTFSFPKIYTREELEGLTEQLLFSSHPESFSINIETAKLNLPLLANYLIHQSKNPVSAMELKVTYLHTP